MVCWNHSLPATVDEPEISPSDAGIVCGWSTSTQHPIPDICDAELFEWDGMSE